MAYHSTLIRIVYLLTFLGQALVLWAVIHRKLHREIRCFTTFLVYMVFEILCVYPLYELAGAGDRTAKDRYIYTDWVLEGFAQILVVCFLIEVMYRALAQYLSVRKAATCVLVSAAAVFFVVALATTSFGHASYPGTRILNAVIRSVRLFQAGLILAFFAMARYLALSLKNYQFGILLAFGLYAASDLAVAALVAEYGGGVGYKAMLIEAFSNIAMYLIWFYYILKQEPKAPPPLPPTGPDDLEQWNRALSDLKNR